MGTHTVAAEVAVPVVTDNRLREISGELVRPTQLLLTIMSQGKPRQQLPKCPQVCGQVSWGFHSPPCAMVWSLNFCQELKMLQGKQFLGFPWGQNCKWQELVWLARALV